MPLIYDIETNGLLEATNTIHSLVIQDTATDQMWSCCDHDYTSTRKGVTVMPVKHGVELLQDKVSDGDLVAGHNIICFDQPAVRKVFPKFVVPIEQVRDTLNIVRLIWPEVKEQVDFPLTRGSWRGRPLARVEPGPWMGRHRLGDWGIRLGQPKDDYAERMLEKGIDPWAAWNPDMQFYCEQDVLTNRALWNLILAQKYSEIAILLEMQFQEVIFHQEQFGFPFDVKAGQRLYTDLAARRLELEDQLREKFPAWYRPVSEFTPKADNRRFGYVAGATMTKVALTEFNPNSRQHIADRLRKVRGWEPTELTGTGEAVVSETVLEALASEKEWDECKLMSEHLMIQKRIGMLAEGKYAWLKMEKDGRIHGGVITNGAVTGRCTHRNPNIAQTPKVTSPYGKECRALFYAPKDWELLGADASGLELRILAHYMAKYDGGAYAKILLESDIHSANASALFGIPLDTFMAGRKDESLLLPVANDHKGAGEYLKAMPPGKRKTIKVKDYYGYRRDQTKTFIYAFLYGAGPEKIGSIVYPLAAAEFQKKIGAKLTKSFLDRTPALKRLREDVKAAAKMRGYLLGLDGRRLYVRKAHATLNTLFQSAGAIVMKKATVTFHQLQLQAGYARGVDFGFCANVHDEYQELVKLGLGDKLGPLAVQAIREAGLFFKLRIPLDGEYKVGRNWADTH